jgi:hypothetical protein
MLSKNHIRIPVQIECRALLQVGNRQYTIVRVCYWKKLLRYAPDSQLLHSVTSLQNVLAVLGLFEDSHSGRT